MNKEEVKKEIEINIEKYDDEIGKLALRIYQNKDCYVGHQDWNHWRALARFCIKYAKEKGKHA
jgi:hypothetical protein